MISVIRKGLNIEIEKKSLLKRKADLIIINKLSNSQLSDTLSNPNKVNPKNSKPNKIITKR